MINIGRLLSPTPFPVRGNIKFHQAKIIDVVNMGEDMYWSLLKVWDLDRKDLINEENEETMKLSDFDLWKLYAFSSTPFRNRIIDSVDCFLHTKIEFLPLSNTISIGENESAILLDELFYLTMKEMAKSLSNLSSEQKDEQYQENDNMSDREREMIRKMREREKLLNKLKNGDNDEVGDRLIKQVISLVAIGKYTFDEVYNMTIVQMIYLLKKYVDIQNYELYTILSPYMDSKKTEPIKHWLST